MQEHEVPSRNIGGHLGILGVIQYHQDHAGSLGGMQNYARSVNTGYIIMQEHAREYRDIPGENGKI